jgi:ABC-type tungstate transport system substrate-binding protein
VRRGPAKVKGGAPPGAAVSRGPGALLGSFALLCLAVFALAGRHIDEPGLYYDEVIQATPASEFLREGGEPLQIPGARSTWLFGGWFPVMTQPYMGALKSQILIPTFAVFGATPRSLRLTTLAWGCLGVLLTMLWVRELQGGPAALVTGALLALDPSFLWVSRHDWGSVALALVLRAGGLLLVTRGWRNASSGRSASISSLRSSLQLAGGGLLFGFGIFNKLDAGPFLAAVTLAFALRAPRSIWTGLRRHGQRGLAVASGLLLGAAPMLIGLPGVWATVRATLRGQAQRGGELAEKLGAWVTTLDGSYFQRLMLSGGSFEGLGAVEGATRGPFLAILVLATAVLATSLVRDSRRGELDRTRAFALVALGLTVLGYLAMPRAVRVHHVLNAAPLPQLVVALAALRLWRERGRAVALRRALAALGVALALAGHLWVNLRTLESIHATGGRGRWSQALARFGEELPGDTRVVSLDWGFHAPLRFLRPGLHLEEPIWKMNRARRRGEVFTLEGKPGDVYLVQAPALQVFGAGATLLEAVEQLPAGSATVREHADGAGETAFLSIGFARPHRLVYRGAFEVRLR